ncbi:MAG: tetratricopeptide repeat protein, partial [Bacteroidales bacterium]|nr:tetratricopeptide repeat protein [Bacteroidales bacterium]
QDYRDAAGMLERAVEYLPERPRIRYNLALIYQQLNQLRKAEAMLKSGLEKTPGHFDLLFALADLYVKQNRFVEAKQFALKLNELYPDNPVGDQILQSIPR